MKLLQKWLEKRIEKLEAERTHLRGLLPQVFSDDAHEKHISRLVNAGVKVKAFKEVLAYMATHRGAQ